MLLLLACPALGSLLPALKGAGTHAPCLTLPLTAAAAGIRAAPSPPLPPAAAKNVPAGGIDLWIEWGDGQRAKLDFHHLLDHKHTMHTLIMHFVKIVKKSGGRPREQRGNE